MRPFLFLAGWFAVATAQLILNVVRPPLPDTDSRTLLLLAAATGVLCVASLLVGWIAPSEAVAVALMFGAEGVLAGVVIVAAGGQGQLMAAFYLLMLQTIAALFLRSRLVWMVLVVGLVLYLAAAAVNARLDTPGYAAFVVVVVSLITVVLTRLVASLHEQATRDQLTGVLNRHGLDETAITAHDRDARAHQQTTIVEIDLDGFKAYNDSHGHHAGDLLLSSLADAWRKELRHTDILARTGGDEFVLVLPATSTEEAETLIGRMRTAHPAPWSHGVATWAPGEGMPDALMRADIEMYEHKPRGPRGSTGVAPQG